MSKTVITFSTAGLEEAFESRRSTAWDTPEAIARRDLRRYYDLLSRILPTIRLSKGEAALICDALKSTVIVEPSSLPQIWDSMDEAIRVNRLDRRWYVDGRQLVAKMRTYAPSQLIALIDAVERFWVNPNPLDDSLRRVGLVR